MTSLRKNYILSLISQTVTVLSPLIVTPFVARRLLADNIGIFSFTESVVFIFGLFALLGSHTYGQREIAYCQGNKRQQLQIFAEVFLASGITTAVVLAGYIIFAAMQKQYQLIYFIQIAELIAFHWDITWFYQGKEDFKTLLYRNMLVKALYIILVFLLIRDTGDLPVYVILRVGTFLLGNMTLLFPVVYQCFKENIRVSAGVLLPHIRKMIPLFLPQIAIQIYTVLDKTMIGIITQSPYQNGCYEEAMKVIRVLMNFVGAAAGVLMPRIASLHASGNQEEIGNKMFNGIRFVFLITLPMVFGIVVVAPVFMPWFLGPGFEDAIGILQILAGLLLLIGVGRITGSCLLAVKEEKQYTRNVCIGAAVNFSLNLWLISCFQAMGAAIASLVAELTVTLLMLYYCRKFLDFGKLVKCLLTYLLCSAAMYATLITVKSRLYIDVLWQLLILAVTGMMIYGAGLLIIRDEIVLSMIKMIWKKRGKNCP